MSSPHIAVIGGGTGGLGLAHALHNAGISVSVHERHRVRTERLQGYRVSLNPDGSRALSRCLSARRWQEFLDHCVEADYGDQVLTDTQLRERLRLRAAPRKVVADRAEATNDIQRSTLQTLLASGLEDIVHYDQDFTRYEHLPNGQVRCHFADGGSTVADLVVGADGGRSRVRAQLLPTAKRHDTGMFIVAGKYLLTEERAQNLPAQLRTGITGALEMRGCSLMSMPIRQNKNGGVNDETYQHNPVLFDNTVDYLLWSYNASPSHHPGLTRGADPHTLRELVGSLIADWHPGLRRMVADTEAETISLLPVHTADPVRPWPTTRVTLLGDAIHSMTPFLGLGAGTALRDARLLADRIIEVANGGRDLLAAVGEYEREMLDYGFAAVADSRRASRMFLADNAFARLAFGAASRLLTAFPSLQQKFVNQ
ncbi:FAD-dependent oxidoreductase [Crossiella cryophila]|uniref:2-polyprenyl-6-methoxyphenol hydroxylase-like FAD-dependent oxidoreductase n=1 Tax=Crossiella cryophila TaxID=43355 RepID=A0A7W7CBT5_9PSEU|nr:NAD(P)/FAD-dependent oxidoreductase [Crossiella cryophila]MBB4678295.1 2-polyprenyl-6-methoxyphenol hydroxylase-like FAD-dependent oxidoreductase [Crossiella cryophila]